MLFILGSLLLSAHYLSEHYYVLGTDKVGQDVLYQSIKSIRTAVLIGLLTTLIMLPFAILLGGIAGYFRGYVDDVIQYIYTTVSSIPSVLLISAAILSVQMLLDRSYSSMTSEYRADIRLLMLCILLGFTSWSHLCRLIRAETLKLTQMDYVNVSQSFGMTSFYIIINHILPNVAPIIWMTIALDFSGLVLSESILTYLGIGVCSNDL